MGIYRISIDKARAGTKSGRRTRIAAERSRPASGVTAAQTVLILSKSALLGGNQTPLDCAEALPVQVERDGRVGGEAMRARRVVAQYRALQAEDREPGGKSVCESLYKGLVDHA